MRKPAILLIMLLIIVPWAQAAEPLSFVALGDSYTEGPGVARPETWPTLLSEHLRSSGIPLEAMYNLGRSGWTTKQVIDFQLPVFDQLKPDFVTILIGANDCVQGLDATQFRQDLRFLLDHLIAGMPDKNHLFVLTIPDFSVTPYAKNFGGRDNLARRIVEFNAIILEEAGLRNLKTVDLYPVSRDMQNDPGLISPDGLHPSAKEYVLWENLIFEQVSPNLSSLRERSENQ